jgi:hypothetical protein
MTTATLAFPDCDELWTVREHALAAQQTAAALFRSEQWVWAYKALGRAERFFRRLADAENPFAQAGHAILGPTPPPRAAPRAAPGPGPMIPQVSREDSEDLHARLVEQLAILNAQRAASGEKLATLRQLIEDLGRDYGPVFVADMLEIEARLNPIPSG